ncbi:MAG: hypothetical protein PQJ61_08880 [Spirochaetales bacterium]|uniref:Uncharacterized protein n=1 Tax=Candidatus Thalassospirochaeta sargassi TaxID=3119039 RepID=A0AAJ1IFI8_9SPIO|nr:hypothetical protein [Spirochaetales bacterium]
MSNKLPRKNIFQQLKLDFPGSSISFDEARDLLLMDNHKISLLLDREELERVNVHSRNGRNYYQAIVQLIYSNYQLVPQKNSYADSMIAYREDYNQFRIGNLARDYGIGFLEDDKDVMAVKIDADFESPVMIEEDEDLQEKMRIERLKQELLEENELKTGDYGILLNLDEP